MTREQRCQFKRLCLELSPENLCCDGELSAAETKKKHKRLKTEWKRLERKVGYSVSEADLWE